MKDYKVSVRKLTDDSLMREACESTFLGKSHASLAAMYKAEHSPARTQLFWIRLENIPLFVSTHLLRHHVGVVPFQLTCREDRKGGNVGFFDRIGEIESYIARDWEDLMGDWNDNSKALLEDVLSKLEWLKYNADRETPVNLSLLANAQALMDMAKVRLCSQAHIQTRIIFDAIALEISKVDPDLASMMVPKCVYRNGLCGEPKCCGYNSTEGFQRALGDYVARFSERQRGMKRHDQEEK